MLYTYNLKYIKKQFPRSYGTSTSDNNSLETFDNFMLFTRISKYIRHLQIKKLYSCCFSCFEKAVIDEKDFVDDCTHALSDKYIYGVLHDYSPNRIDLALVCFFNKKTFQLTSLFCCGVFEKEINGSHLYFIQGYQGYNFDQIEMSYIKIIQPMIDEMYKSWNVIYHQNYLTVSFHGFSLYAAIRQQLVDVNCLKLCFPFWIHSLFIKLGLISEERWYTLQRNALKYFEQLLRVYYSITDMAFLFIPFVGAFVFLNEFIITGFRKPEQEAAIYHNMPKKEIRERLGLLPVYHLNNLWKKAWLSALNKEGVLTSFKPTFALSLGLDSYSTLWHISGKETSTFVNYISCCLDAQLYKLEWLDSNKIRASEIQKILDINMSRVTYVETPERMRWLLQDIEYEKQYKKEQLFNSTYISSFRRDKFKNNITFYWINDIEKEDKTYNFNKSRHLFENSRLKKRILNALSSI